MSVVAHPLRGLYAITPDGWAAGDLLAAVDQLLAGGCRILQYRDKLAEPGVRKSMARTLAQRCRSAGAALIINDDVALALAVDAAGVHLGQDDGDLAAARAQLGAGRILGASCYASLALARQAAAAGADYVAFGAVYPSPTKPQAVTAPHTLFTDWQREAALPACAIGGIQLAGAPALLAAGADMLAVITDLFAAPDIAGQAAAYQSLFRMNAP